MKIAQENLGSNPDCNQHGEEILSRRSVLFESLVIASTTLITGLAAISELSRDRSVSVDEIVNNPSGPIRYREVVCRGLIKGAGYTDITILVGGFPTSSSAAATGAYGNSREVVRKLPVYTLYGSTDNISLPVFRDCDGVQEMFASWKTTALEKQLQSGGEAFVQVTGHVCIRDGKQCVAFTSIQQLIPGKNY